MKLTLFKKRIKFFYIVNLYNKKGEKQKNKILSNTVVTINVDDEELLFDEDKLNLIIPNYHSIQKIDSNVINHLK